MASDRLTVSSETQPTPDNNPVLPVVVPVRADGAATPGGFLLAELKLGPLPVVWTEEQLPIGSSVVLLDERDGRGEPVVDLYVRHGRWFLGAHPAEERAELSDLAGVPVQAARAEPVS